ncbi:sodium:glutamate symporter [Acidaminococcus sp. AM05-11]|uniref:sodium/glutamate symporter n=1 Tax=Acidaminococcus sp. AM05-11 TaxID=2291997 RepID=UPI000E4AA039|nr:sodium/glutamate symporter [Acidaminococcus sp. AM05-11]RHK01366.1 sodium:glutamate symporter [Acidaminococcus sp. AM05-11]
MKITLDLLTTTGVAAFVVLLGRYIVARVKVFRDFCIPAAVVSGLLVSILMCLLKVYGGISVVWTGQLTGWSMNLFFTAVGIGFTAELLRKGGKLCVQIAIASVILITLQNIVGVAIAKMTGVNPLIGIACGSAAMYGGVGTAGAFGPIFERLGCDGATVIGVAAGTFGMVVASLFGGPTARYLIKTHHLQPLPEDQENVEITNTKEVHPLDTKKVSTAFFMLLLIAGLGVPVYKVLKLIPQVEMPYFVGCLFSGVICRNVMEALKIEIPEKEISVLEHIMLDFFIALTLMTMDMTKLFAVAGPMLLILIGEVLLACFFGTFIAYYMYGKNYNAAVMVAGLVGVGLGAAPNAVANEKSVMDEFGWANMAWTIFPAMSILIGNTYNPLYITAIQKFVAGL